MGFFLSSGEYVSDDTMRKTNADNIIDEAEDLLNSGLFDDVFENLNEALRLLKTYYTVDNEGFKNNELEDIREVIQNVKNDISNVYIPELHNYIRNI